MIRGYTTMKYWQMRREPAAVEDSSRAIPAARVMAFLLVSCAIWTGYYLWRPVGPMLGLNHIEHLGQQSTSVALTIDDAPHPLTTPLLLAALKRAGVKATFFVVGDGLRLYPELAQRIVSDGHQLANHSQYHKNLTRVHPSEYAQEVETCFTSIEQALKANPAGKAQRGTRLFRPPGGGLNRDLMQYLYENDITLAWWSNNVGDWAPLPPWKIATSVTAGLKAGDIILMHDGGLGTPQAIPHIVRTATRRGLTFVTMPVQQG